MNEKRKAGRPMKAQPREINTLADWLISRRLELGLTQTEVNARLGGRVNICLFETGKRANPTMKTVALIEALFGKIPDKFKVVSE